MEPGLAARHPEISTYSGTGIDVPGSTVHLDLSPLGLHASVLGPEGAWYIDPYYRGEQSVVRQLLRARPDAQPARGLRRTRRARRARSALGLQPRAAGRAVDGAAPDLPAGPRRAIPRTPATSATANVTAAKVALMNRVNQVYENDLAIHMVLVADNDKLNFETKAEMTGHDGPCGTARCYKPAQVAFCSGATLVRSDTVIGQIIGAGNYDIGHIALGVNGGGIAARRRRRRRLEGRGLHGRADAGGRPLRDRLRRARDGPPVRRRAHLQRQSLELRLRQPQPEHVGRARQRLDDHGLRRDLPLGRPAAPQRSRTSPSAASSRSATTSALTGPSSTRFRASPCGTSTPTATRSPSPTTARRRSRSSGARTTPRPGSRQRSSPSRVGRRRWSRSAAGATR